MSDKRKDSSGKALKQENPNANRADISTAIPPAEKDSTYTPLLLMNSAKRR